MLRHALRPSVAARRGFVSHAATSVAVDRAAEHEFGNLSSLAPLALEPAKAEIDQLVAHITASQRLLVLTGAGISTHSGIPDYRSPNGSYSRGHKPVLHAEFVQSADQRRRYWARSYIGWAFFSRAAPNAAHAALAALERRGRLAHLITQNVDRLHQARPLHLYS